MSTPNTIDYVAADKAKYAGEVTEVQIAAWKTANPKGIFRIISDDGKCIGYFRNPFIGDVNTALSLASNKEPLNGITEFARVLWLGGSDAIKNEEQVWLGVAPQLRTKMDGFKARLENL